MSQDLPLGELACLAAALSWAISLGLFRPLVTAHGAAAANLAKNTIAMLLLAVTTLVLGQFSTLLAAPPQALFFLAISGVAGLSLGDTALFVAADRLGTHRSLLLMTLSPIFTGVIAFAISGERLSGRQLLGAVVILLATAAVVAPGSRRAKAAAIAVGGSGIGDLLASPARRPQTPQISQISSALPSPPLDVLLEGGKSALRTGTGFGILAGILAALGQAVGIILTKLGVDAVPLVAASFLRLVVAVPALALALLLTRRRALRIFRQPRALLATTPPTLLGSYAGFLLMTVGIAYASASVAAVLLATSPVFTLVFDGISGREPFTLRGVLGTLAAISGVVLLTLPS